MMYFNQPSRFLFIYHLWWKCRKDAM